MVEHTNVLIPWYPVSYLTIATSSVFFLGRRTKCGHLEDRTLAVVSLILSL